jgi:hypothetical protein
MGQNKSKSARSAGSDLNGQVNGNRKQKKANKKLLPEELDELETKTYCEFYIAFLK